MLVRMAVVNANGNKAETPRCIHCKKQPANIVNAVKSFRRLAAALTLTAILSPAFTRAQNIFVSDFANNRIFELDSSGQPTLFAGSGLEEPTGLAFDSQGNLYAANYLNNTVTKFAYINGKLSTNGTTFASSGLNGPSGLAFDKFGYLYVANAVANTIERFDSAGNGTLFASSGLNGPNGILFDPAGNLFVANTGGNTINKFSPAGADLGTIVTGGLSEPAGMALYGDDGSGGYQILVANIGNNRIAEFDSIKTNQTAVAFANSSLQSPTDILLDAPDILVANYSDGTIQKFQLGDTNGTSFTGGLGQPRFMARQPTITRTQDIFASNLSGNTIERYNYATLTRTTFAGSGLNEPEGLAFDGLGNLYVANFGNNTVEKFAYVGGALSTNGTVFASTGLHNPSALAVDGYGNVYVANDANNTVEKFSPAGADLGVFASANLDDPQGLAFDDGGNLYVANLLNGTVEKFSPTGTDLGAFITGLSSVRGLGYFEGNLYVADSGANSVAIYGTNDLFQDTLSTALNQPWSVAFDNSGAFGTTNVVYVANRGNNTIEEYHNLAAVRNFGSGLSSTTYIAVQSIPREAQPATVTLGNLMQSYDGTAKSVSVTTVPPGLMVNVTYNGSVAAPTNVGSYTVVGIVNDPNYQGGTTNILIISLPMAVLDWNNVHQRIDGFGGGVVFLDPPSLDPVTDANMDTLFDTNNANQLGLTLLRVRIDPTTNWSNALSDGQKAVARGAGVLATPWTPPAGMKDNTNIIGGSLLPAQYTNYAIYLNSFAGYMSSNGVSLKAISIQNEPDFVPTGYEGCGWTATQLQTFCHNVAGLITNAPVIMPESASYNQAMSDPMLNDPVATANITFIGEHPYGPTDAGAPIVDYPLAHNEGKPTWVTEFLVNDQTIGTAITTAEQIHDCLTVGNFSAYIWWKCLGDTNGLVDATGTPQKRGFVMAQWSRFVRHGDYRIDTSATVGSAFISAFENTNTGEFAIVAVNTNATTSVFQTFSLSNFPAAGSVTPWITSATMSLSNQTPVAISGSSFSYTLPPLSVVTFAGQGHTAPSNIIIFNVSYKPTPPAFVLTWNSAVGATYSVLKTNVLGGSIANWPAIVTGYPAGGATGGPLLYTDTTATVSPTFYGIRRP